jgi:hypothetical protein
MGVNQAPEHCLERLDFVEVRICWDVGLESLNAYIMSDMGHVMAADTSIMRNLNWEEKNNVR